MVRVSTKDGKSDIRILRGIQLAKNVIQMLNNALRNRNKLRQIRRCIAMRYRGEGWTVYPETMRNLEESGICFYTRILKIPGRNE